MCVLLVFFSIFVGNVWGAFWGTNAYLALKGCYFCQVYVYIYILSGLVARWCGTRTGPGLGSGWHQIRVQAWHLFALVFRTCAEVFLRRLGTRLGSFLNMFHQVSEEYAPRHGPTVIPLIYVTFSPCVAIDRFVTLFEQQNRKHNSSLSILVELSNNCFPNMEDTNPPNSFYM